MSRKQSAVILVLYDFKSNDNVIVFGRKIELVHSKWESIFGHYQLFSIAAHTVIALNIFVSFLISIFLHTFMYSSYNYCDSNTELSLFLLLRAIVKSKLKHIAIAIERNSWKSNIYKKAQSRKEAEN